jgi:chemotaxis protein histidine kinase CheA
VDEIVGQREMIVRPMQPPLTGLPLYAGVGLLEEGSVVLVLDPASLAG